MNAPISFYYLLIQFQVPWAPAHHFLYKKTPTLYRSILGALFSNFPPFVQRFPPGQVNNGGTGKYSIHDTNHYRGRPPGQQERYYFDYSLRLRNPL